MKTAMKKLFSLVLVAVLLVGVMPFQAFADTEPYVGVAAARAYVDNEKHDFDTLFDEGTYSAQDIISRVYSGNVEACVIKTNYGEYQLDASEIYVPGNSYLYIYITPAAVSHTHSYTGAVTTQPTCTEAGVKTFTCSCGEGTYTEPVAALGHTEATDAAVAPTCEETGLTEGKHCSVCGDVLVAQTVVEALNHNFVDGYCTNCQMCYTCKNNPCTCNKTVYAVNIYVTKDGNDSTIARTYKEGSEITLNAALVDEVAFGSADVAWIVNGRTVTNGSTITVDGPLTISCSITNKATEKQTIILNANGGRLQSYESQRYTVVIGQPYGNLPEPTRESYTFAYWYYKDNNGNEQPVDDTTRVESTSPLYAKWIANGVTVTFQRYDMIEGWVTVDADTVTVPAYSVLCVEDNTFPSNSRINLIYDVDGFDIEGWKVVETGASFKEDHTKVTSEITLRPIYKGTVKLTAQEPVTGASWKSFKVTLEIGEVIGDLKNPGSRSNYAFEGWVASNGSTEICDRFCESDLRYYPHLYGTEFFAKWEGGITVTLHIHIDGNTKTAAKIVPYYVAPAKGEFNMKTIDMYSLYDRYYHYDDSCDKIYGWYDSEEWKNYCANRAAHAATSYMDIEENGQYDFHIMLINKGDSSSSSSSSSKADSSNPKTGDMIFNAVTVMGASAACLATLFYLNKKRAV